MDNMLYKMLMLNVINFSILNAILVQNAASGQRFSFKILNFQVHLAKSSVKELRTFNISLSDTFRRNMYTLQ